MQGRPGSGRPTRYAPLHPSYSLTIDTHPLPTALLHGDAQLAATSPRQGNVLEPSRCAFDAPCPFRRHRDDCARWCTTRSQRTANTLLPMESQQTRWIASECKCQRGRRRPAPSEYNQLPANMTDGQRTRQMVNQRNRRPANATEASEYERWPADDMTRHRRRDTT
jgi:hypothetical protein